MSQLSAEKGAALVTLARKAIERCLAAGQPERAYKSILEELKEAGEAGEPWERAQAMKPEPRAVFVSLKTWPWRELRGCMGFPWPIKPLEEAVVESAINSAFNDPRFPPLGARELERVTIEVSVLTQPQLIEVKDWREYPRCIKVGVDGLILEYGIYTGLLLPQVAKEFKWSSEQFLSQVCLKAGLPSTFWMRSDVKIYKFQAQIFAERRPRGEIIEVK